MTEAVSSSNDADAAARRAADQARLRKERREAKIKAGGSSRLDKITGVDGRIVGDSKDISASTPTPAATTDDDPEEVDISQHHYSPQRTARPPQPSPNTTPLGSNVSEDQLRQMMLGFDRSAQPSPFPSTNNTTTNPNMQMPPGMEDDPIMKMMSQMMGGQGGFPGMPGSGSGGGNASAAFPGSNPFGGNMPFMQQQAATGGDAYTSFWKFLHATVALGLGIYVALLTSFTGTRTEREREAIAYDPLSDANERHKKMFFWVFATAESLLLTTRFFLDKRRAAAASSTPGMLNMVLSYLPEPYRGYIQVGLRYLQMISTLRADILGCMFVLGVCAWWTS